MRRAWGDHALAALQRDRGPNEVGRENVQRRLVVSCNVSGRDGGDIAEPLSAMCRSSDRIGLAALQGLGGLVER
jgi:Cu/Ag efflux pump CusA